MYLLYDLVIAVCGLLLLPVLSLRERFSGSNLYDLDQRLGISGTRNLLLPKDQDVVLIHAASVGEIQIASFLARKIKEVNPQSFVLVSCMTKSGLQTSNQSEFIDAVVMFPIDFGPIIKRFLRRIGPRAIMIVETEIWPNFCREAKRLDIPLVLVNGRISDQSYPRYRLFRFFLRPILDCFSSFCMQSQVDSERIVSLGARRERVENVGNIKFDYAIDLVTDARVRSTKERYRLPEQAAIVVAGSTHDGEETQLVEVYRNLCRQLDRPILLVLIPRHPQRSQDIQAQIKEGGLQCRLRSSLQPADSYLAPTQILLVDTLGEVLDFYSVADLVFVGGSLVPVGGHNMLEASRVGKPVLFGPHVHNFKEISSKLIRAGAGIQVAGRAELEEQSLTLLRDPARRRAMGQAGQALITENSGAIDRTLRFVARALGCR